MRPLLAIRFSRTNGRIALARAFQVGLKPSRSVFAARFGLRARTVRNREQGRTRPDEPARVLLRVIAREITGIAAADFSRLRREAVASGVRRRTGAPGGRR